MGACAAPQQQEAIPPDPTVACYSALANDARFGAIRSKTPSVLSQTTLEQLADRDRVKDENKPLLSEFVAARQECVARGVSHRQQYYDPESVAVFSGIESRQMDSFADLYAGTITWGEFNRNRRALGDEYRQRSAQISQRRQAQAAIQRQQAMTDLLLLQSLQPRPAPAVNCETRRIGSTAYTSCR